MFNKDKIMKEGIVIKCSNDIEWKNLCYWMESELGYRNWDKFPFHEECPCIYVKYNTLGSLGTYSNSRDTIIPYNEALSSFKETKSPKEFDPWENPHITRFISDSLLTISSSGDLYIDTSPKQFLIVKENKLLF